MDGPDPSEEPNLNTGMPWSSWGGRDIRWQLDHNESIEEIANFLCRTPSEIRRRIEQIAEADAIGDPSLLRDGLTDRDRVALETYRDARAAMALMRKAVEDCAPPGSIAREIHNLMINILTIGQRSLRMLLSLDLTKRNTAAGGCCLANSDLTPRKVIGHGHPE